MSTRLQTSSDTVDVFDSDITRNHGYLYTTNAPLSSRLANERITLATLANVELHGARMIDIGCGDGTFTAEVFERARPAYMAAVDPSSEAIRIANEKKETRAIEFAVQSAYELPWPDDAFDVACIRCALHHMERPIDALREALRIAPLIIGIEPNGYNPVLKILEKVSPYHIEHEERSYRPAKLDSWLAGLGAVVTRREWIGLVPMFSPDWFARFFKMFEPVVERIPVVNRICCAQYVFVADRRLAR